MRRLLAVSLSLALGGALPLGATAAPAIEAAAPAMHVAAPAMQDGVATWSAPLRTSPGTTTSPRIDTAPFTLAALSWDVAAAQPHHLELRVLEGGTWGAWFDLAVDTTPSPDGRVATEPFIADGSTSLQTRVGADAAVTGLRVDLVAVDVAADVTSTSLARPSAPSAAPATATGSELRPAIVTRARWGANEKRTDQVSSSTWLKAMYVHHTAGPNTYSRSRAKAVVRSIWAFHTKGRGWPDIGYQFLVDRFGTVYEGRRGAIAGLPVGAQAGGFNASTIGVAVMGDFTRATPPRRVVDAVVDVLAWQAHRWGVDPRGKVRLRTASSTGSKPRWSKGRLTPALPVIRGHRDTNHTACPGARLYAKLPAIRRAVDTKVARAERRHGPTPAQLPAPRVAPLARSAAPVSLGAKVALTWSPVKGARRYEVLKRSAPYGKDAEQTTYAWFEVTTSRRTTATVTVPRGQTWTIAVRAIDRLGRPGKVREVATTTRPVPAARVERTGAWTTARDPAYFGGTVHVSRGRGATLTVRKAVDARRVWLIAATRPTSGRVAVYAGSRRVAVVSLATAEAEPRARVRVPLPRRFTGKVRVVALDSLKPVRISAIVLERGPLT